MKRILNLRCCQVVRTEFVEKPLRYFGSVILFSVAFLRLPQHAVTQMKELKTVQGKISCLLELFIRNTCKFHII